jgi:hypothetical protein
MPPFGDSLNVLAASTHGFVERLALGERAIDHGRWNVIKESRELIVSGMLRVQID